MRKVTIETIEHATSRQVSQNVETVLLRMVADCTIADNTKFVNRYVDLLEFVADHQVDNADSNLGEFMNMRHVSFANLKTSFKKHIQFKQTIDEIAKTILQDADVAIVKTGQSNIQGNHELSSRDFYTLMELIVDSGMIYHVDDTSNIAISAKESIPA